ncbi:hypothetical protein PUMCH_003125 [Australozyma saopauloensis]|uniref:Copper transport protein n=1 Tax=Australozyma saopauloensis TaxID=291208 RepID=A0AAX4HBK7_9ASCO|nr:hypothetical protein PUMCH_003125 [[Candida] saopauloensis]
MDSIIESAAKMDMGGGMAAKKNTCKISMLWNWYTIDSCFIARSWHVKSKGAFAGSCVGVFFLVVVSQWLHRFAREYDAALMSSKVRQYGDEDTKNDSVSTARSANGNPMLAAFSHKWFVTPKSLGGIYATPFEHLVRCVLFTLEWGLSYMIMLLFMYYNGYIIISCILGAFFGRLFFTYNEPLNCTTINDSLENDRKCCP